MDYFEWKVLYVVVTLLQPYASLSESSSVRPNVITNIDLAENENNDVVPKLVGGYAKNSKSTLSNLVSADVTKIKSENVGFAAEWECDWMDIGDTPPPTKPRQYYTFPLPRVGPGTWHDAAGNWWVFGGRDPSSMNPKKRNDMFNSINDLWIYSPSESSSSSSSQKNEKVHTWKMAFQQEENSASSHSSFAGKPDFPLLCGTENSRHIALFGDLKSVASASEKNPNSQFSEKNVVRVFDTSKMFGEEQEEKGNVTKDKQGSWTSYICCDACLPYGNTTLEFCPQFSRDPIAWCGQNSIMMVQLVLPIPTGSNILKEDNHNGGEFNSSLTGSPQPTVTSSVNLITANLQNIEMSRSTLKDTENVDKNVNKEKKSERDGNPSITNKSNPGRALHWWKFDLISTQWIKMPEVNIGSELMDQIQNEKCRVVSSSTLVYILCPTKGSLLNRDVLLFDPYNASVKLLGRIHLNNAFSDKKVWRPERSALHAVQCDNQTVILVAYQKLLDLWIHDHSSNKLFPVENVWKGSSLHAFQRLTSFYKLSISLPTPFLSSSPSKNESHKPHEHHSNERKETTTHSFFMLNPRSKLASFEDSFAPAHFRIRVVPDREVFLPARDASYFIPSSKLSQSNDKSAPVKTESARDDKNFMLHLMMDEPPRPGIEDKKQSKKLERVTSPPKLLAPSPLESPDKMELHRSTKYRRENKKAANNVTKDQVRKQEATPFISFTVGSNLTTESSLDTVTKEEVVTPSPSPLPLVDKLRYKSELENPHQRQLGSPQLLFPASAKRALFSEKISRPEEHARNLMNTDRRKSGIMMWQQKQTNASFVKSPSTSDGNDETISTSGFMTRITTTTPIASGSLDATLNGTRADGQVAPDVSVNQPQQRKLQSAGKSLSESGEWRTLTQTNSTTQNISTSLISSFSPKTLPLLNSNNNSQDVASTHDLSTKVLATTENGEIITTDATVRNDYFPKNDESNTTSLKPAQLKIVQADSLLLDVSKSESSLNEKEGAQGDTDSPQRSMTYGSSEIIVEHKNDILSLGEEGSFSGDTGYGPTVFFASTLTFFASIGVVLFFRRCVKCPPSRESVLLKEPPTLHYSAIPDDFSFHVPIV